ncbi:CGNR zinc finger domain-containing protein [Georgenia sp. TF02-10]|uniref:CGNR zinc finger domain-containing protein n=1 Tax=Georgenia sp. TF02-10 TaxID=2917725 RepID=UPI001FA7E699|nr:CGNR zinc finger domain-containing protein [Georgenia sp. TF02-10]UNX53216.1 CGNR zinc finger domain-containing protein [Georgenia sp. TF02-10]
MTGNGRVPADSGYPEPGGRAPAPPPLRLAQVFVNTADREAGADALQSPGDLVQWLASYDLLDARAPAGPDDIALALDLREGLRGLFLSHNDGPDAGPTDPDDVKNERRLERALAQLPVRMTVTGGVVGTAPSSDSPVRAALTEIAVVLVRADPAQLTRLKACRRDVCRWVFYDSSRNRGSTWCAMGICGARTKMATYRDRRRDR